jgi:hypothetical protein
MVYFMTIWSILPPLEIFYGQLVYFVVIWYNFPRFGILDQEKSGNTGYRLKRQIQTHVTEIMYIYLLRFKHSRLKC